MSDTTNLRAKLAALGYRTYRDYLHSNHWQAVRQRYYRERRKRGCDRCGNQETLHLHHRTYDRLGCELHRDLEALCSSCHDAAHAGHYPEPKRQPSAPMPVRKKKRKYVRYNPPRHRVETEAELRSRLIAAGWTNDDAGWHHKQHGGPHRLGKAWWLNDRSRHAKRPR